MDVGLEEKVALKVTQGVKSLLEAGGGGRPRRRVC